MVAREPGRGSRSVRRRARVDVRHLCEQPGAGIRWPTTRRPKLRRILMPRTENHVYFQVEASTQTVHVLAVWGAPRGRGPRL
jgi:hypothetical protein